MKRAQGSLEQFAVVVGTVVEWVCPDCNIVTETELEEVAARALKAGTAAKCKCQHCGACAEVEDKDYSSRHLTTLCPGCRCNTDTELDCADLRDVAEGGMVLIECTHCGKQYHMQQTP